MNTRLNVSRLLGAPHAAALLTAALLAACGGTDQTPSADSAAAAKAAPSAGSGSPAFAGTPVLVADDGTAMPSAPQAVPADAGARTRAGRYALGTQAAQLERALGDRVVRVDVTGSGAAAVEVHAGLVYALMASRDLPNHAPVLVAGADLRTAAAVVDRLAAEGVRNVWLVTQ